jgi:hypothetical protein
VAAPTGVISTVAGGVGGPEKATRASLLYAVCGVASGGGRVYVGAPGVVREVSAASDLLTTAVGTGFSGPVGDGGPAASASVGCPQVTVDPSGDLVLADSENNRVRVVAARTGTLYGRPVTAGDIYTVAGDGIRGFSGDGGPAVSAELSNPKSAAVDSAGNLLIADSGNDRVRVVAATTGTFYGQAMTTGDIYTVAGDGKFGFSGDGGPAVRAKLAPQGVAVDGAGNLLIADSGNDRIRVVAATTGTFYGQTMTTGDIYTIAGGGTSGLGDGGPATSAEFYPTAVAVDGAGNLLIADSGHFRVRVVAVSTGTFYGQQMTAGDIYTIAGDGSDVFAGDGGPATSAGLYGLQGVAVDAAGNLLIADSGHFRVRVVAVSTGTFYGQQMTAGDIYTIAGALTGFPGFSSAPARAQLGTPAGVVVDTAGNVLFTTGPPGDSLDPPHPDDGVVALAARTGTFYGQQMTAGHLYVVAGTGHDGFAGDGGPATRARLWDPYGLALDRAGNLVIADSHNNRIRVVAATTGTFYGQQMTAGDIYTVLSYDAPAGLAVDRAGNVLLTCEGGQEVQALAETTGTFYGQKMTAGNVYTVAGDGRYGYSGDGGPATSASLNFPRGVGTDAAGNLLIADTNNSRIRVVADSTGTFYGQAMTVGDIYTVAGGGTRGLGDGGPATTATLSYPQGVTVDRAGNLLIADTNDDRIRVIAASTGTFYGHKMTAGDIYTVAGDGIAGYSGNGGRAATAELNNPLAVAADGANLIIADYTNQQIREVTG